ncbi:MAG: hypothetical protein PF447_15220 [Spirochaetaceae bacterium]|nr:hypothetical protein [Spirochaetaceae bacterium]
MNKLYFFMALLILLFLSCASYERNVVLAPLSPELPVSASSSLYIQNQIIPASEYKVVYEFEFITRSKQPLWNKLPSTQIEIQSQLDEIKTEYGAEAITNLSIELLDVRAGDLYVISMERWLGSFGVLYTGFGLFLATTQGDSFGQSDALSLAGLAAGTGALWGGSFLHQRLAKATYIYRIKGEAVILNAE